MTMDLSGFSDLNIVSSEATNVRETVIQALKFGYRNIAINTEYSDTWTSAKAKKKRKQDSNDFGIPPPTKVEFTDKTLQKLGITFKPCILSRLTIIYSDPSSPFLHKGKKMIGEYDILAFTPTTEVALKQVCQESPINVDIINLDYNDMEIIRLMSRKLLMTAINRDIYFEISYSPCIGNSGGRQNVLVLAHTLFSKIRCKNIIVTSRAHNPNQLRPPYDVINLARFFNLTLLGSKAAVLNNPLNVIHCANARRSGWSKCNAKLTFLEDKIEESLDQKENKKIKVS